MVVRAVEDDLDHHGRWNLGGKPRQLRLDLVDRLDDVGAGLLIDVQQNAGIVVLVGGDVAVGGFGDGAADIAHPDRRAVAIGQYDIVERLRLGDLVVGRDGERGLRRY